MSEVSTLHVTGDVRLHRVSYDQAVTRFPAQPATTSLPPAEPPRGGYFTQRPAFPCGLPEPIEDGGQISISGRVKLLPFYLAVNLLSGSQLFPEPDIILHMSARFKVRDDVDVVVVNSKAAGWAQEARPVLFPFRPGRRFQLSLTCQPAGWEVAVDGALLLRFPHRLSKSLAVALDVRGDVLVQSVHYQPNSPDLIQL